MRADTSSDGVNIPHCCITIVAESDPRCHSTSVQRPLHYRVSPRQRGKILSTMGVSFVPSSMPAEMILIFEPDFAPTQGRSR